MKIHSHYHETQHFFKVSLLIFGVSLHYRDGTAIRETTSFFNSFQSIQIIGKLVRKQTTSLYPRQSSGLEAGSNDVGKWPKAHVKRNTDLVYSPKDPQSLGFLKIVRLSISFLISFEVE